MTSEETLRIRSYLTAQGAKLSPDQLIGNVQEAMAQLRAAASAVPPARFNEPPAPGEWSANEVMAHVVLGDVIGLQRSVWRRRVLLNGDEQSFQGRVEGLW